MPTPEGVQRLAEAVLRAASGDVVYLRLPVPATSGDPAEELGMPGSGTQDQPLFPAAFRKEDSTAKVIVAATAVNSLLNNTSSANAEALFSTAAGVVANGTLYEITSVVASQTAGVVYAYCLSLKPPAQ